MVQLQMAFAIRQVLAGNMRDKLGESAVNDASVQAWYEENKARFDKPEVHARMILVPSESQAKDLIDRVKKGEPFGALAKAHSIDRSKSKDGDLGWFKEQEIPEVGDDAFAAKKGDLLGPIEGRLGFYVLEVLDKRDATPIEDVRKEAEAQIAHAEGVRKIDEIRKSMKVEWVKPLPDAGAPAMPVGLPAGHPPAGAPPGAPPAAADAGGGARSPHGGKAPGGEGKPGKAPAHP